MTTASNSIDKVDSDGFQSFSAKKSKNTVKQESNKARIQLQYKDTPQAWIQASCQKKVNTKQNSDRGNPFTSVQGENKSLTGSSKGSESSSNQKRYKPHQRPGKKVSKVKSSSQNGERINIPVTLSNPTKVVKSVSSVDKILPPKSEITNSHVKYSEPNIRNKTKPNCDELVKTRRKKTNSTKAEAKRVNKTQGNSVRPNSTNISSGPPITEDPQRWEKVSAPSRSDVLTSTKKNSDEGEWKVQGKRRRRTAESRRKGKQDSTRFA